MRRRTAPVAIVNCRLHLRAGVAYGNCHQRRHREQQQCDASAQYVDLTMKACGILNLTGTQVAIGMDGRGSDILVAGGAVNIAGYGWV